MRRKQWILFAIGMSGLFPSLAIALLLANHHPWLLALPASFVLLLVGGTLGWSLVQAAGNHRIRRTGVPVVGRVMHARSSGSVNRVPNWEIVVALPDGSTAELMVVRRSPFTPNEPIALLVDPNRPSRAVIAPAPSSDF